MNENRRRVVVTGIAMVTPLGNDRETTWAALRNGESGVDYISLFDASSFPTQIAAEVKHLDLTDFVPWPERYAKCGRNTKFAIAAAATVREESGIVGSVAPERLGVYLGAGEGELDFLNFVRAVNGSWKDGELDTAEFIRRGLEAFDRELEFEQEPGVSASHVARIFNAHGPNLNCLTACAASAQAIGEATRLIQTGVVDAMIAGGCHSMIHPFGLIGFNLLTALSTRNDEPQKASRPFDMRRDGFVLGEGAGMLVLEELQHALDRGAQVWGEIIGYGSSADAYRATDMHPEGRGGIQAIRAALQDAGIGPEEVDYINAHGTSTAVNDRVETLAIKQVFGEYAYDIPVSSTKSMMGHLIAAAGAVEMGICLLAMRDGILPPTINYETQDPDCDLDYVPNTARRQETRIAVSNSFGFGGQNICLVCRKPTW